MFNSALFWLDVVIGIFSGIIEVSPTGIGKLLLEIDKKVVQEWEEDRCSTKEIEISRV